MTVYQRYAVASGLGDTVDSYREVPHLRAALKALSSAHDEHDIEGYEPRGYVVTRLKYDPEGVYAGLSLGEVWWAIAPVDSTVARHWKQNTEE